MSDRSGERELLTNSFQYYWGMGTEADVFLKQLAQKISRKKDMPYSKVISFIRRRMRFDLVRTTMIALRGFRGKAHQTPEKIQDLDIHL